MELTTLKYFYEVARLGGLTRASESINVSQSAISRRIKNLENEAGCPLFVKSRYGYSLTNAGEYFYSRAEQILKLCSTALQEVGGKSIDVTEPLSIGFMGNTFDGFVPDLVEDFRIAFPKVGLLFYGGARKRINDQLQGNKIDIAFQYYFKKPEKIQFVNTGITRRIGVLMRKDDPLTCRAYIDVPTLNSIPLIVPQVEEVNPDREMDLPFDLTKANIIAQADSPTTLIGLVLKRQAYIYCVEPLSDRSLGDLFEFRPLSPETAVSLNIVRAAKPIHQESSKAFIDFAESYIGSLT